MEVEVDEFFREIYKMQKFFQQKQKKADQEREKTTPKKKREKGEQDDKQENSTVFICSRVLEQVKDFKVPTWLNMPVPCHVRHKEMCPLSLEQDGFFL